ncbi:MAG TPA: hypothetical protein H9671_05300 [Firmicutes bacterium]|nr:hypothetical protein [Bacillota bacterium]
MGFCFYGNEQAVQTLTFSAESGRFSHAYLLYGEAGLGKKTLAKRFAQAILCQNRPEYGQDKQVSGPCPCENCSSCRKVFSASHPDLIWMGLHEKGKNSFHAEEARKLRSDAYILPNDGACKVYILCGVDDMTVAAANSLLKVIEEPPASTVIFLLCENRFAVPETVRSRCIQLPLRPVSEQECEQALSMQAPGHAPDEYQRAARISGGNIGKGLQVLTDGSAGEHTVLAAQIAESLLAPDEFSLLSTFSSLDANRQKAYDSISYCILILRDAACKKAGGTVYLTPFVSLADALAERTALTRLFKAVDAMQYALGCLDRNANIGLTLGYLSANIWMILHEK